MQIVTLFCLCAVTAAKFEHYEGFKVYELRLKNQQQQDLIVSFVGNEFFDFWSAPNTVGLPTTIMVHPQAQIEFTRTLYTANIPYSVLIKNVERILQAEGNHQNRAGKLERGNITFTAYHRYSDIENYIQRLAHDYPDIVTLENFQTTYDGNALWLVKIGKRDVNKPTIFIDGGIHAREWISPAVVLYIIHQLVENTANRDLLEHIHWYVIPVLNPDGYEYSHTTERMWRLNRAPVKNATCKGTDLNRNFDFHWGQVGVLHNPPCNDLFPGREPFDQLESSGLRNVIDQYNKQIELYLTFHSYANAIVYPWSFTREPPKNAAELQLIGERVAKGIAKVNGTTYRVGISAQKMGLIAGCSDDWVKGVGGVELSYTIELSGHREGGFLLPASRILDVGKEIFEGVKVYHNYIEKKFGNTKFA